MEKKTLGVKTMGPRLETIPYEQIADTKVLTTTQRESSPMTKTALAESLTNCFPCLKSPWSELDPPTGVHCLDHPCL